MQTKNHETIAHRRFKYTESKVFLCPIAIVTNYHISSGLTQHQFIILQF